MKIGVLSDTHGWLDKRVVKFFDGCVEVWHCGDVGTVSVLEELRRRFRVRAVYGNIDGGEIRQELRGMEVFECEGVKVVMTHIGGYPGHYESGMRSVLAKERPRLFVCGHSHILKVMYDKSLDCLHVNPGAAGRFGFHKVCTAVRFSIGEGGITDLEVLEFEKYSK